MPRESRSEKSVPFLLPKWLRFNRFRKKKEAEANLFFSIKEQDSVLHLE